MADSVGTTTHNLLVVSDLHFGETLGPDARRYVKRIARFNQAFCRFLRYYAEHRLDDKPWRLVIAGDMMDFVRATLSQEAAQQPGGTAQERAIRALEQIIDHQPRVFRALARFVAQGHELVIIRGNHDVELHWDQVQARFIERLLNFATEEELEAEGFQERIAIMQWFYYEHDLVYIEHGNQYDEYCSFEHVLAPMIQEDTEVPISHHLFCSFAAMVDSLNIHAIEHLKMVDYLKWLSRLGPKLWARLAYAYFAVLSWMWGTRRKLSGAARAKVEHLARLEKLTSRFKLGQDSLFALDRLRSRPASLGFFSALQMLYMDRVFLGAFGVAALAALFILPIGGVVRGVLSLGVVFSVLSVIGVLAPLREVEADPKLRRVAKQVAQVVGVPFVIFGHTHVPTVEPIRAGRAEERTFYLNTGSWSAGEEHGLTHILVRGGARASAELLQWDLERGAPKALAHANLKSIAPGDLG